MNGERMEGEGVKGEGEGKEDKNTITIFTSCDNEFYWKKVLKGTFKTSLDRKTNDIFW